MTPRLAIYALTLLAMLPFSAQTMAKEPPNGTYLCYYSGANFTLFSSSLTQIELLSGKKIKIVGEKVPYSFDSQTSMLTVEAGAFKGFSGKYQLDSKKKSILVFNRAENKKKGYKVDLSDTWCYLE